MRTDGNWKRAVCVRTLWTHTGAHTHTHTDGEKKKKKRECDGLT